MALLICDATDERWRGLIYGEAAVIFRRGAHARRSSAIRRLVGSSRLKARETHAALTILRGRGAGVPFAGRALVWRLTGQPVILVR
jgi:hypothetical protein